MIQLKKEHSFFAVWTLQGVIPHGKKKTLAPGIKIKNDPVFRSMDSPVQLIVDLAVSGIKTIVASHFEIFFRNVLNEKLDKIDSRKGFLNENIVFMPVVMEGHVIPVVGIDPGKGNDGAAKVAADIFDNGFGVTEIRLSVNIKAIFVLAVYFRFYFLERRADALFQFI